MKSMTKSLRITATTVRLVVGMKSPRLKRTLKRKGKRQEDMEDCYIFLDYKNWLLSSCSARIIKENIGDQKKNKQGLVISTNKDNPY